MKVYIKTACFLLMTTVLTACSSRKYTPSTSQAARAADAMAKLSNKDLYRFITDWTGVKYRLGGLDKNGIDCSGFALLLEKDIYGLTIPRRSVEQAGVVENKNLNQLKEGDLIFFSFGGAEIDHVGVYLNRNYFVHASPTRGIIVDDLNLPGYQKAIVKAGTVKN
jgi:probable lipoprotein NlpC